MMEPGQPIPGDWYDGRIPVNAEIDDTVYVGSTYAFHLYRSEAPVGLRIARGVGLYGSATFDVGPNGRVTVGQFAGLNGPRIICDSLIEIGDHAMVSWNVVIMDTYRLSLDPAVRRQELARASARTPRWLEGSGETKPIHIGNNTWLGFDSCIMPGVHVGEGSIVGARSVVFDDVEPYTIVAGNPARVIRRIG